MRSVNLAVERRIVGLDVLRASAILLVMVHHFRHTEATPEWLRFFGLRSFIGVDVFFVLSGFLIGSQMLRTRPSLAAFYQRRWLRTVPAYLATLVLLLALGRVAFADVPAFALFAQNYVAPDAWLVSWSLCIEEHFYVVLPLCIAAPRFAACLAIAVSLVGRAWAFDPGMTYDRFIDTFYVRSHLRLDGLGLGVLFAASASANTRLWRTLQRAPRAWAVAGVTLALASAYLPALTGDTSAPEERLRWFMAVPEFFLVSLGVALTLPCAASLRSIHRAVDVVCVFVAEHAFTLYLTHELAWGGWLQRFALAFAFAMALRWAIEKPFLRLRRSERG